jgi:hypothetical protein
MGDELCSWMPAFAGMMDVVSWIPAFAGMTWVAKVHRSLLYRFATE